MLLHDAQELDDDLGRGSDEDLSLALALSVDDAVESIVEDGNANHLAKFVLIGRIGGLESICYAPTGRVQRYSAICSDQHILLTTTSFSFYLSSPSSLDQPAGARKRSLRM